MSEPAIELQGLLRALAEQQTALLSAHAENVHLQRVLVERLLGSMQAPATVATEAALTMTGSPPWAVERSDAIAPTVEVVVIDAPPPAVSVHIAPAMASTDTIREPEQAAEPTATAGSPLGEGPTLRVVGGTAVRSERHYQPAQSKPPQRVSPEALDFSDVSRLSARWRT